LLRLTSGLYDQRVALEWVQENIGGVAVHAHLMAGVPLFSRAIMQSGCLADCMGPVTVNGPRTQGDFDMLVKRFGLEDRDDQGKVDGLRAVSIEDLLQVLGELEYTCFCSFFLTAVPVPIFIPW
jgi:carboxylesterase type B